MTSSEANLPTLALTHLTNYGRSIAHASPSPHTGKKSFSRVSTAMLTSDINIAILSVCPSVRPSRSGIVSKRLNISSYFLQHNGSTMILIFPIFANF